MLNVTYDRGLTLPRDARVVFRSRLTSHALHERSGVWRFRELLPPVNDSQIVTLQEGNAPELPAERSAAWSGLEGLSVKNLGCNPSGSYKDAGMTVAVTRARVTGAKVLACASTGNTSASLAVYAARAGLPAVVLLPAGHVPTSK
ncbi:MAG: pyridoxal-phosphate dependent enzyme, partial [Vulcanimicrobiaceae bacterium]